MAERIKSTANNFIKLVRTFFLASRHTLIDIFDPFLLILAQSMRSSLKARGAQNTAGGAQNRAGEAELPLNLSTDPRYL